MESTHTRTIASMGPDRLEAGDPDKMIDEKQNISGILQSGSGSAGPQHKNKMCPVEKVMQQQSAAEIKQPRGEFDIYRRQILESVGWTDSCWASSSVTTKDSQRPKASVNRIQSSCWCAFPTMFIKCAGPLHSRDTRHIFRLTRPSPPHRPHSGA